MKILKPDTVVSTGAGTVKILNSFCRNGNTVYTVVTVDNEVRLCYHDDILYIMGE